MPDALYKGMIDFELESESYFNALVLMDETYQVEHPIDYAYGLKGFHIDSGVAETVTELVIDKNQLAINSATVTARSIAKIR